MEVFTVLNIIVAVVLLPVNLVCSFWIFQRALALAGVTFREMLFDFRHVHIPSSSHHGMRRRQRLIFAYLAEKSQEPEKIRRLLRVFGYSTLPGAFSLPLALYGVRFFGTDRVKYLILGNLILILINVVLLVVGKVYQNSHPLDAQLEEMLKAKRAKEKEAARPHRKRNIVVYSLAGLFFAGVLSVILLAAGGVLQGYEFINSPAEPSSETQPVFDTQQALSTAYPVESVLNTYGFETGTGVTSFWEFDQNKLTYEIYGDKDSAVFEYYEYTDSATVNTVYDRIIESIWPGMEQEERAAHERALPRGGKMFDLTDEYNSRYIVLYQENTVIYALFMQNTDEIDQILIDLSYTKA